MYAETVSRDQRGELWTSRFTLIELLVVVSSDGAYEGFAPRLDLKVLGGE